MEQSIVMFQVADKSYGVPVEFVRSVEQGVEVSTVPRTAAFIRGVFELRGEVLPLIDMRERLGHEQRAASEGFVLVVDVDSVQTGFLVDNVKDVIAVDSSQIEPAPSMIGGLEAQFIHGLVKVAEGVLVLLALPKLLADAEIAQLKQLEESRMPQ